MELTHVNVEVRFMSPFLRAEPHQTHAVTVPLRCNGSSLTVIFAFFLCNGSVTASSVRTVRISKPAHRKKKKS